MSLEGLLVHDVTILTPGTTAGRYGDAEKNWATASSSSVKGWMSQRDNSEVLGDREAQVSEWVLFVMPDVTIDGTCRVVWLSTTFEVAGPPNHAWTPRGEHHIEANLQVVDG